MYVLSIKTTCKFLKLVTGCLNVYIENYSLYDFFFSKVKSFSIFDYSGFLLMLMASYKLTIYCISCEILCCIGINMESHENNIHICMYIFIHILFILITMYAAI